MKVKRLITEDIESKINANQQLIEAWNPYSTDAYNYLLDMLKYNINTMEKMSDDAKKQKLSPESSEYKYLQQQGKKLVGQSYWAYKKLGEFFDKDYCEKEYI